VVHLFCKALLLLAALVASVSVARAHTSPYMEEKEPARHALVIGNSVYEFLSKLPSARIDAERTAAQLEHLGFRVTRVLDLPSVRHFEDEVIPDFRKNIEPGDLVVVFFSGHGFAYGSHNFVAPTGMSLSVQQREVADVAISIENLQDYLEKRSPGLLLFLVDACRTIAGFVVAAPGNQNLVAKSVAEPSKGGRGVNTMIGFAARPGFIALGTEEQGALSLFSASLVSRIATEGNGFGSIFKEISVDVWQASGNVQQPGLFDWSNTDPFLKPTASIQILEREAWQSSLATGKRSVIERFALRNSVSRFASSARKWLSDNPVDKTAPTFTLISPAAVERAWRPDGQRVAIAPIFGGFAYERALPIQSGARVAKLRDEDLGLMRSGNKGFQPELYSLKQALLAHRTVITTSDVAASNTPMNPKFDEILKSGSRISIDRFAKTSSGMPLLVGRIPGDARQLYVPLSREWSKPVSPVELGKSLRELNLSPPTRGFKDVVDADQVLAAIAELKSQGRTVTWVSVAVARSTDPREYDGRLARLTHATYVLNRAGIDERRLSAVPTADDVNGDSVRLRFFGY